MSDFQGQWNGIVQSIEGGWRRARRSSQVSLLPVLTLEDDFPRSVHLKFSVTADLDDAVKVTMTPPGGGNFRIRDKDGWKTLDEPVLRVEAPAPVYFDGLRLLPRKDGHKATLETSRNGEGLRYKVVLALESVTLSPVLAESSLLRSAQRDMSAREALEESADFSATCGPQSLVVAGDDAGATLEIACTGDQPNRDTVWNATLRVEQRFAVAEQQASLQVNHSPFAVAQMLRPDIVPEAGSILAQWSSADTDGAQWRFGVETVKLHLPPQAVGEAMVRGSRFWHGGNESPVPQERTIGYRFSRRTELSVRPSRQDRRYTVHPGDLLSVLRNAEVQRLVTELSYPLEVTYERTPDLLRTIVVSEVGSALGRPAVALPEALPETAFSSLLAEYYRKQGVPMAAIVKAQRDRHLAARFSFRHRVAQFPLADASFPSRKLDLREGLVARLRGRHEFAAGIDPLPHGDSFNEQQRLDLDAFLEQEGGSTLPAGLLYSVESANELGAILRTPTSKDVQLMELSLSVLGATGAMQAAFDEGRTVFDVQVENGQLTRLVKTRYGRIAAVWNKARHVVIYERSAAPGAQFQAEQKDEWFPGRPLLRKMEEYIEILEPHRLFAGEAGAGENRPGCLHAFRFATRTIHVNSAWGKDVATGYVIPLYNELDTSGFYVKPWMGPEARGGGGELAQHWNRKPQHVYFYTNTEPGKGADSDLWEARRGVDLGERAGLGAISALRTANGDAQVRGGALLEQRVVPSYTLDAVADPRFAMEVDADGLSNLMQGRAAEELVASVRTMQVERTLATSRVDFGPNGLLGIRPDGSVAKKPLEEMKVAADALWQAARPAAELKSVEAAIATILDDAHTLWKTFGAAGSCERLKKELKARVDAAFAESRGRLVGTLEVLPKKQAELAGSIEEGYKLAQRLPDAALDAACAEGERAIATLRVRLAALPAALEARKQAWERIAELYLVFPVRALLRHAATALGAPVAMLDGLLGELDALALALARQEAELAATVEKVQTEVAALLASVPGPDFQQRVLACIVAASAEIGTRDAALQALRQRVGGLRMPEQVQGLQQLRRHALALLQGAGKLTAAALGLLENARKEIAAIDPADYAALRAGLQQGITDALGTLAARVGQAADEAAAFIALPRAQLQALRDAVAKQQGALANGGFDGSIKDAFAAELRAYSALEEAIALARADITEEMRAFDVALELVRTQLARPDTDVRAPLAVRLTAYLNAEAQALAPLVGAVAAVMEDINGRVTAALQALQTGLPDALKQRKEEVDALIDGLDCAAWDRFAGQLERQVSGIVEDLRDEVIDRAASLFDQETVRQAIAVGDAVAGVIARAKGSGERLLEEICDAVAPQAGQAIKLTRLVTDPPQLPQLTIRTDRLECVYDDLKDQIETSPFVARLRELDAGIKELGLALPSRQLFKQIIPDSLKDLDFSKVIRNASLDFAQLFKRFKLPQMPANAIRITHHIDPKTRSASVKAEVDHQFDSTESLFDVSALSMDIRRPRLVARTNFDISATESGKARSQALFSGDWILNFGGQPLVTFVGASIQYSDDGGFKFDLDPKKIEPHAALKFIGDVIRAQMPELPETVDILKNSEGMPVGASIVQNHAIGPLEFGGISIGETVLASGFGLRIVDGQMNIDASFGIGARDAPVFLQIGLYGGGGWLTARARAEYNDKGEFEPGFDASVGIALGSTKSFSLASVAHGHYALRLFVEAAFSSKGQGNSFIAGLQLTGSARILGYLNAYLNLLVQVEHTGGQMRGSGRLDVSIKVCWCYTVRVSRTVQQDM